ncbi:MAG TPA: class I SAM-dependent methyltransferase [Pyrinomonadaceae bacterium]|nr:class I SAM-dependent methyltransferase [Pyrinomonadaceae bacterium]
MSLHASEVARGERFEFGENWSRFLAALDEERIREAEDSLKRMLEVESLEGRSFLDIGSGSGLFSLAARRLGARVHSLDYDPRSVACTRELRRRYFPEDPAWKVEEGSALDADYIRSLGLFDVVYSWGVLHHTGEMWRALENAQLPVAPGGRLFVAIYNDTGTQAARWKWIKKTYNRLPRLLRPPFAALAIAPDELKPALRALVRLRPGEYVRRWTGYDKNRGMSRWRDIVDWVGGYPYEVATPDEIFDFYRARGFTLTRLKCGYVGLGCNEFVFVRDGGGRG